MHAACHSTLMNRKQGNSTDLHLTPPPDLEGISGFHHHFRLSPSAAGCVRVCTQTVSETMVLKLISCSETAH